MSFVGPLYIFSKHDKFIYLLSTINGEVIELTFHVSHLEWGLLRLPNGKSVSNINDYKLEMIRLQQQHVIQPVKLVTDSSQTSVKTVLYTQNNDLSHISQILIFLISGVNILQYSRHQFLPAKQIYYTFIMHMPACQLQQKLSQILFSHQSSNYRGHVTPSQYQSVDLNLVISRLFAITVMKNLVYGRPSDIILKMTLSQVHQLWSFILPVLERNMSQNISNTCKMLIRLYHWIWRIWYKLYSADTIDIHCSSFSTYMFLIPYHLSLIYAWMSQHSIQLNYRRYTRISHIWILYYAGHMVWPPIYHIMNYFHWFFKIILILIYAFIICLFMIAVDSWYVISFINCHTWHRI